MNDNIKNQKFIFNNFKLILILIAMYNLNYACNVL